MAMKVCYNVVNGQVLSEIRGGVRRSYVTDGLGSTLALLDSTGAKTDTFDYFPSGTVAARTGTTPTPFQWNGGSGYYRDNAKRTHVRARNFNVNLGRWQEPDPIGFKGGDFNLYRYVNNRFVVGTDPSGTIRLLPRLDEWTTGTSWDNKSCCGKYHTVWQVEHDGRPNAKRFVIVQKVQMNAIFKDCPKNKCNEQGFPSNLLFWERIDSEDNFNVYPRFTGCSGSISMQGEMRAFDPVVEDDINNKWNRRGCGGFSGDLPCTTDEPSWWDSGAEDEDEHRAYHSAGSSWTCCKPVMPLQYSISFGYPGGFVQKADKCL